MDKISIILPTRNRWDMLFVRAIPSVIAQTHSNWELIVVDDGSNTPLETKMWVKDANDIRIKSFRIEKTYPYPKDDKKTEWLAGPCLALNEGLSHVTGDWIARLDDDDIWLPDMLETMLNFAKSGDCDFVSALWWDKDGLIGMPEMFGTIPVGGVQTWLYKAKYKDVEYNPDCWQKEHNANNEWDLMERLLQRKIKIAFLPKVVCKIIPRPGQETIGLKTYLE